MPDHHHISYERSFIPNGLSFFDGRRFLGFLTLGLLLCSFTLTFEESDKAGGQNRVPNASFEDTASFTKHWTIPYGSYSFEDSIQYDGDLSVKIEPEDGKTDLFIDSIRAGAGRHHIAFWYQGRGFTGKSDKFIVEVVQGDRTLKVFHPWKDKKRNFISTQEWQYFSKYVKLDSNGPLKLFIHTRVGEFWIDNVIVEPA